MKTSYILPTFFALSLVGAAPALSGADFVDLGGPASGFLAISNAKNSATQDGIENKNGETNGLPDYANYQMANGNWTAIIASPLDAGADYSDFADFSTGFSGSTFTVNNRTTTQPDAASLSAGRIDFDNSLITGSGTETVGVGDLSFNFDTFAWDGITDNGFDTGLGDIDISPFSPIHTPYNDGSGAGNAAFYYNISIANVTGSGLSFVDGELDSMDLTGDLTVQNSNALNAALTVAYSGTFTADGLSYSFDVNEQQDFPFIFSDVNMIFNRSGTASVVPEPSAFALVLGLIGLAAASTRRRRGK